MPIELPRAVTFDCWNTLIVEGDPEGSRRERARLLHAALSAEGFERTIERVERALYEAWWHHNAQWLEGVQWGGAKIALHALELLNAPTHDRGELVAELESASLRSGVRALDGARETLTRLASRGVGLALICDTGFTPGRVVRQLLDGQGLLDPLAVTVFSDEIGAPKPDPRMFAAALDGLGVEPHLAVHVGDLRRTDVSGARNAGMGSVRIRDVNDDVTDAHPEADWVADSHAALCRHFAL